MSTRILIFETSDADESVLQEIVTLLSKRADTRIAELHQGVGPGTDLKQDVLSFPDLEIHIKEQAVYKNGRLVPMSYYEFSTLCYLARHPGWVFTKQQIYEAVWHEPEGDCNTAITNVISQIRKKLHPHDPKDSYIKTVVNSGYKFDPQLHRP